MPWKRPDRIPARALSSLSAPLGGCISQCSVTSPLATAGVCWWTQGAHCLGPPPGKPPALCPEPILSLRWALGWENQPLVRAGTLHLLAFWPGLVRVKVLGEQRALSTLVLMF